MKSPFPIFPICTKLFSTNFNDHSERNTCNPSWPGLEYALYYYADIQHVYELEHCWMYLNVREELIGVKATRHGVFITLFSTPQSIQYFKGDPILFVAPGKHEMTSDLTMFNLQILDKACSSSSGIGWTLSLLFCRSGQPAPDRSS